MMFVANMMLGVVLDENPLDSVLSLNGNPLDEVMLDGICLDDLFK